MRRRSSYIIQYLTVVSLDKGSSKYTGEQASFLAIKITCTDLEWLILILHVRVDFSKPLDWIATSLTSKLCRSFCIVSECWYLSIFLKHRSGPNTNYCGTCINTMKFISFRFFIFLFRSVYLLSTDVRLILKTGALSTVKRPTNI